MSAPVRDGDETFQNRAGAAAVDGFRSHCGAVLEALSLARDNQRCGGVEDCDVPIGALGAIEHRPQGGGVMGGIATLEISGIGAGQARLFGCHFETTDLTILQRAHPGGASGGHLVEPVGAMHQPDLLRAQIVEHMSQGLQQGAREDAYKLTFHISWI